MAQEPLIIKKYGNRRLYNTDESKYITLEELAQLIRQGHDVKVIDAKTNEDLTKTVLLQIITEQEKEKDLLPLSFLKKMIQVGDASFRDAFQRYLGASLETFITAQREFQERYRNMAQSFLNPMFWMMPPFTPPSDRENSFAKGPTEQPPKSEPPPPSFHEDHNSSPKDPQEPLQPQVPPNIEDSPQSTGSQENNQNVSDDDTRSQLEALKQQLAQIQKTIAKLDK